jgi:hypothetical protein
MPSGNESQDATLWFSARISGVNTLEVGRNVDAEVAAVTDATTPAAAARKHGGSTVQRVTTGRLVLQPVEKHLRISWAETALVRMEIQTLVGRDYCHKSRFYI